MIAIIMCAQSLLHLDYSKQYLPPLLPQLLHWTCNVVLPYVIIITYQSPPLSWQVVAGRRNVAKGSENGKRTDSGKSKEYQLTNILFSLLPAQLFSVRNAECIEESLFSPQTGVNKLPFPPTLIGEKFLNIACQGRITIDFPFKGR